MDAYIYQADIWCQDCAEAIREELTTEGKSPAVWPKGERSYDSDEYPKGPYPDGGGEADCPQHCGGCGVYLRNPLTSDGVRYVIEAAVECLEQGDVPTVALDEWIGDLLGYGGLTAAEGYVLKACAALPRT